MSEPHEDIRDVLPDDLNAVDNRAEYRFPDNSRRRIPAVLYAIVAAACLGVRFAAGSGSALVNDGLVLAAALLVFAGAVSLTSGWRMTVDESRALVLAAGTVGFVTGHASAQQVWRGLRSRPTWRIFCYSDEEPPLSRALVLVDAVDGRVVECLVEQNPGTATASPDGRDG
jgi:hypothetical protein